MRACLWWLSLAVAGCGTLRTESPPQRLTLSDSDHRFAQALARYTQGMISEKELGLRAPATLDHYSKAAALDPGRHATHAKVAVSALQQGRGDDAVATLEESCRRNPESLSVRVDLAATCQLTGRVDEAVKHYREALKLGPDKTFLYLTLARLYFLRNEDDRAIAVLRSGIGKAEEQPPLFAYALQQGQLFASAGQLPRAAACFQFLARHAPDGANRYQHLLGEVYEGLDQPGRAARYYVAACKADPPFPESFVRLALLRLRKSVLAAIETLVDADRRMPEQPAILFPLAHIYSISDMHDEALATYRRIQDVAEKAGQGQLAAAFYISYGAACERAGRRDQAVEVFEACLQHYPKAHEALNYVAYMWAEGNVNLDKALEYVNRALKEEPENGAYVDTLGWIYYRQGRYEEALALLLKANELVGKDPTVNDHVGDAYKALGNTEKAIEYWTESFKLDQGNQAVAGKLLDHGVNVDLLRKEAEAESRVGQPE